MLEHNTDIYKLSFETKDNDNNEDVIFVKLTKACQITGIGRNRMLKYSKMKGFPGLVSQHKILVEKNEIHNWLKKIHPKYANQTNRR